MGTERSQNRRGISIVKVGKQRQGGCAWDLVGRLFRRGSPPDTIAYRGLRYIARGVWYKYGRY